MPFYYGWIIVAVCLLLQATTQGLSFYTFTFWIAPWMEEFHVGRGMIMYGVTAAVFTSGILSAPVGRTMGTRSIRALICIGGIAFALGFLLISQASSIWQIILIYAVFIASGMVLSGPLAAQILVAKWFRARRGLAIGLVATGAQIGGLLCPPIVTALLAAFGWRQSHLILAAASALLIIPLAWFLIRNTPQDKGVEPEPDGSRPEPLDDDRSGRHWTIGAIVRDRGFSVIALAFVPQAVAINGITQNLAPLAHDLGFTSTMTSTFMSALAATCLGANIVFGGLADRMDQRYLYWFTTGSLAVALVIVIGQPSRYWTMLLASGLIGVASGGVFPLMGAMVGDRFGARAFGQAMGLLYLFLTLCSFAPLLSGWIRDQTGTYGAVFLVFLSTLIPAASAMVFLPRLSNGQSTSVGVAREPL